MRLMDRNACVLLSAVSLKVWICRNLQISNPCETTRTGTSARPPQEGETSYMLLALC
nr:MAG TPA_asm: hypothetical protein [Caudoviricetes sp.]